MDYQPSEVPVRPPAQREPTAWDRFKKFIGPLVIVAVLVAKFFANLKFLFLPLLKFFPVILKSGGTMLLTIWIYAAIWGWKWGVGFVLLLLLHECGHLVVARWFGLPVSAPMFIPFMGAFIALKEAPRNAWIEACVGIGGPILGSAAAFGCHLIGLTFGLPLFVALAWSAYFLNLFNLTPVGMLDGGRIASALSPWLWMPGLAVLAWIGWTYPNFIVWLVLLLSLPRVISLFRKRTEEEQRYFEVATGQRWLMAAMYFGLIVALVFGMHVSRAELEARGVHSRAEKPDILVQ